VGKRPLIARGEWSPTVQVPSFYQRASSCNLQRQTRRHRHTDALKSIAAALTEVKLVPQSPQLQAVLPGGRWKHRIKATLLVILLTISQDFTGQVTTKIG